MRPRFTQEHKRQLRNQDVTAEQIEALEKVLPHILLSAQSVPMNDVRERLQNIADAAHALAAAIKRLDHGTDPADSAAAWRLDEAHSDQLAADHLADPLQAHYPDNPDPQALRGEIERLESITNAAIEPLQGRQSRRRTGSPWPVSQIDDALLQGWNRTHTAHLSDDDLRNGNYPPIPDYPFKPRKGGAFREIVSICYQAAGHPTTDPEWAIKSYLHSERERWEWMDANLIDEGDASP